MNNARFETKKTLKVAKHRRVAGVQVRSGVKAGIVTRREVRRAHALDRRI